MLIKTHLIPKQLAVSPRAPPPETQVVLGVEKGTVGDGQLWLHLETGEGELVSQASPGGKRELRVSKTSLASRPKRGLSRATSAHQSRPLRGQAGWKERDRRTGRQTDGGATQASRVARGRSTVRKFFPPQNFFFRRDLAQRPIWTCRRAGFSTLTQKGQDQKPARGIRPLPHGGLPCPCTREPWPRPGALAPPRRWPRVGQRAGACRTLLARCPVTSAETMVRQLLPKAAQVLTPPSLPGGRDESPRLARRPSHLNAPGPP